MLISDEHNIYYGLLRNQKWRKYWGYVNIWNPATMTLPAMRMARIMAVILTNRLFNIRTFLP